jgi:hypothetical protein
MIGDFDLITWLLTHTWVWIPGGIILWGVLYRVWWEWRTPPDETRRLREQVQAKRDAWAHERAKAYRNPHWRPPPENNKGDGP